MIDGESSKAELLQKVFIWRYYCSYYKLATVFQYNESVDGVVSTDCVCYCVQSYMDDMRVCAERTPAVLWAVLVCARYAADDLL